MSTSKIATDHSAPISRRAVLASLAALGLAYSAPVLFQVNEAMAAPMESGKHHGHRHGSHPSRRSRKSRPSRHDRRSKASRRSRPSRDHRRSKASRRSRPSRMGRI